MALYNYSSSSRQTPSKPVGITEFEILKASHRFLRDGEEKPASWEEQLAEKYYSSLYREFALCDLKHYKSGNFALRWRTEEEVLDGSGETTCGNTRCEHHFPARFQNGEEKLPLTTLELPFAYVEQGENKSALVKVVLCGRCMKKLMWKHNKEKERRRKEEAERLPDSQNSGEEDSKAVRAVDGEDNSERSQQKKRSRKSAEEKERSRSPGRRRRDEKRIKRHSSHDRDHDT